MNFEKDMEFIILLEEMKSIFRRTKIIGQDRRENDAEHTWHIATMALFMKDYASEEIDVDRVIKMLLCHDLVEIFAGDTFAYDVNGNKDKFEREKKSMEKLKSMLSESNASMLEDLWIEFEEMSTSNSKFANAMDRLQPLLANIHSKNGGTWIEGSVRLSQILKRAEPIKVLDPSVYEYVYGKILENVEKGYILKD